MPNVWQNVLCALVGNAHRTMCPQDGEANGGLSCLWHGVPTRKSQRSFEPVQGRSRDHGRGTSSEEGANAITKCPRRKGQGSNCSCWESTWWSCFKPPRPEATGCCADSAHFGATARWPRAMCALRPSFCTRPDCQAPVCLCAACDGTTEEAQGSRRQRALCGRRGGRCGECWNAPPQAHGQQRTRTIRQRWTSRCS